MMRYYDQPAPSTSSSSREVWPTLLRLLEDRVKQGEQKYGQRLSTWDGRDSVRDALDEAIDLVFYLMKLRLELEPQPQSYEAIDDWYWGHYVYVPGYDDPGYDPGSATAGSRMAPPVGQSFTAAGYLSMSGFRKETSTRRERDCL